MLRLLKATIADPGSPLGPDDEERVLAGRLPGEPRRLPAGRGVQQPEHGGGHQLHPRAPLDQEPLVQSLGLDRLDPNNAPNPDGWFDFIDQAATIGVPSSRRTAGSSSRCWNPSAVTWTSS